MPTMPQTYITAQWPRSLTTVEQWSWNEAERQLAIILTDDHGYEVPMVLALTLRGLYMRFGPAPIRPYSLVHEAPAHQPVSLITDEDTLTLTDGQVSVVIGLKAPRPFLTLTEAASDTVWRTAPLGPGSFHDALYRGQGTGSPTVSWLDMELAPGEALYGLGERFNTFNLRGQRVSLWAEDAYGLSGQDAYINTPWIMSTKGWGLFVPTAAASVWDVGQEHGSTLRVVVAEAHFEAYVMLGALPELLSRYFTLTGEPALPPDWSFGLWMSRWGYTSQVEVLQVADQLIKDEIPVSVIHLDPLWLTEKNGHTCPFEWDTSAFPDPVGMMQALKERNIRLSLWINPFMPRDSAVYREARARGYLVVTEDGSVARLPRFDDDSGVVDFTNPAARDWFKGLLRPLLEMGASVFKADFGETAPFELARYANGLSGKAGHNLNGLYYQQSVYEATRDYDPDGAMVWGRSGYAGSQRFPIQWGGDTGVTWEYMQTALRGALTFSLSGGVFTAFDVGGFAGTPTADVYLRWSALGFFFSHIRAHGTTPREPQAFGSDTVAAFRALAQDRQAMMPYILEAARQSTAEHLPLIRPLVLMHPDNPDVRSIDFEYYLGPDLLVAPTLTPLATQEIYLPPGVWQSLYHPDQILLGGWHTLNTPPMDEIWSFVRQDQPSHIASCPRRLVR